MTTAQLLMWRRDILIVKSVCPKLRRVMQFHSFTLPQPASARPPSW